MHIYTTTPPESRIVRVSRVIDYWQAKITYLNRVIARLDSMGAGPEAKTTAEALKQYVRKRLSQAQWEQAELLSQSANRIAQSAAGLLTGDNKGNANRAGKLECDYDGFGGER